MPTRYNILHNSATNTSFYHYVSELLEGNNHGNKNDLSTAQSRQIR